MRNLDPMFDSNFRYLVVKELDKPFLLCVFHMLKSHYRHQGCSGVGMAFPHLFALDYVKTWLRAHRCAGDMQISTASQKSTVKKIQCGNSCRQMLTLFEIFCVGKAFQHLFSALHPDRHVGKHIWKVQT